MAPSLCFPGRALSAMLVLGLLLSACSRAPAPPEPLRPAMVVQAAESRPELSAFAGEIRARHEPALGFRVGGKLQRRLVEVGDQVTEGQALAELDPQDLGLQADAARAALAAAQSEQALTESEFERQRTLRERGLASATAFDTAQARLRAAASQVDAARAQLALARNQRAHGVLRAPAAGVIAQRLAEAGQVVAAGQTVFVLAEDGEREVAITLPEGTIGQVQSGQPVTVQLWSQPERLLAGRIRELAPVADAASRTHAARVRIEDTTESVELGASARVFLQNGNGPRLELPLAAVSANGEAHVMKLDRATGRVHRHPVQVLSYTERGALIGAGLSPDDWVVAGGLHLLSDGQEVRPVDRDNRALTD
ncbi:MAG: efflux RND transporter periplasmic adaptor subunit [Aquimonas sp.]|nr:efflux RND transporter periplasmic adaptor subunit [Aquimonas sp.]